ncbi:MAG: efflux transporter outer membrane subunit [Verrucomicrobia bacterium]|nr:efflux transporter outer membrane subunit [Verrucomicrobiota bacterium]
MKKALLICLCLAGCKVGPDYQAPAITASNTWAAQDALVTQDAPLTDWWKVFNDPLLTKYIELAARYNENVLTAEANILQARGLRTVTASALFPQVSADINATKTFFSKNGPVFAIGTAGGNTNSTSSTTTGLPFVPQVPQIQNLFNALFDASWEIDLFGKTRRSVEAADAQIDTAIQQRNDTLLSVLAELARNYMDLRAAQKQVQLTEANIQLIEENAAIVKDQFSTGYVSDLDVESIEADVATARSALPTYLAQIYRSIYAIAVLTGHPPETFVEELMPHAPLPSIPTSVAVGLRSDLLRRRPDVRRAERNLAAATANVGVAVASFYPSLVFTPDFGFQSLQISNLFQAASRTWAIGGNLDVPIFEGGQLVGNLRASRAAEQAAFHNYQQTVLSALQDAETSVKTCSSDIATMQQLQVATEKNRALVGLTDNRYTSGLVGKIDLLTQERQLIAVEQNLLSSQQTTLVDLIALYKALGGGWESFPTNH